MSSSHTSHVPSPFSGIWLPLVTPFKQDQVDHAALRRLVRHGALGGIAGLAPLGTTGEPATLDETEQLAVLNTVLDAAEGLPVMVGLCGVHPGELLRQLRAFAARPIAGVMVSAPPYVRPTQQGILEHFTRLADASPVPLVLYDIPYRSGVVIEVETLLALAGHPNIRAIKDCGGSPDKTQALITDGRLAVLTGEDANVFSSLCLGAHGAIAAAAHVRPDLFTALYHAIRTQRLDAARAINQALAPLVRALFAEPNPAGPKAALHLLGLIEDGLRSPMTAMTEAGKARLAQAMSALVA